MEVRVFEEDPDLLEGVSLQERPTAARDGVAPAGTHRRRKRPQSATCRCARPATWRCWCSRPARATGHPGLAHVHRALGPEGSSARRTQNPLVPHVVTWRAFALDAARPPRREFRKPLARLDRAAARPLRAAQCALALHVAIRGLRGVDSRLLVFLWTLAEQFGQVERDGRLAAARPHARGAGRAGGCAPHLGDLGAHALARRGALARTGADGCCGAHRRTRWQACRPDNVSSWARRISG